MTISLFVDPPMSGILAGVAGTEGASSRPGADASSHQEWMLQMERAQREAWKIQAVGAGDAAAARAGDAIAAQRPFTGASAQPALAAPTAAAGSATPSAPALGSAAASPTSAAAIPASAPAQTSTPITAPALVTASLREAASTALSAAETVATADAPAPATRRASDASSRDTVRISLQESTDGLLVWMGVDAPLATAAPVLVAQLLSTLSLQGVRPAKVVCNGELLHDATAGGRPLPPISNAKE